MDQFRVMFLGNTLYPLSSSCFFVGGNGLGGFVGYKFDAVLVTTRRAWFELVEEFSAADQAETSGGHFVEEFFLGF